MSYLRDLVRRLQAEQDAELGLTPGTGTTAADGGMRRVEAERLPGPALAGCGPSLSPSFPETKPDAGRTDATPAEPEGVLQVDPATTSGSAPDATPSSEEVP